MGARFVLVFAVAACGRVGFDAAGEGAGDDAATVDAPPSCAQPLRFYADLDGDGHGDAGAPIMACVRPPGASENDTDCDDEQPFVYPGAPEVCDAMDNDCSPATIETCPAGCTVARRPAPDDAHVYIVCSSSRSWSASRTACQAEQAELAKIESAAEDAWIAQVVTMEIGTTNVWIAGADLATEMSWAWTDGEAFWEGGAGGSAVGGAYTNWVAAEPNNSDPMDEDCLAQSPLGWNDMLCTSARDFLCERGD